MLVVAAVLCVAVLLALALWCYHAFLACSGRTTREHLKDIEASLMMKRKCAKARDMRRLCSVGERVEEVVCSPSGTAQ